MCSYWVGLGFYYTSGDIQWRFPIAFQAIFTIIMVSPQTTVLRPARLYVGIPSA